MDAWLNNDDSVTLSDDAIVTELTAGTVLDKDVGDVPVTSGNTVVVESGETPVRS